MAKFTLIVCSALHCILRKAAASLDWDFQQFDQPYLGVHTGVKVYDINNDGFPDILFSAGRHSIDQPYALLNLGPVVDENANTTAIGGVRWSRPLPFGNPGGYYQVDVAPLSTLAQGHHAVLLAGGICTNKDYCTPGNLTPAVLLDAKFHGCSAKDTNPDPMSCQVDWSPIWTETPATGNRNGAFSTMLGAPGEPVIVLVGGGCLTVTHFNSTIQGYPTTPDYVLLAEDKIIDQDDDINRSAGLAVGLVGTKKAIVLGPRTTGYRAPAPVIIVYQEHDGTYSHFHVDEDYNPNTTIPGYAGNENFDLQPTGIALDDLDGNGAIDIIPANFFHWRLIQEDFPVGQHVLLVDENPQDDTPLVETPVFSDYVPARVVTTAQIFPDSPLPDLVYAMASGEIKLFANQGVNVSTGEFMGFAHRQTLSNLFDDSCEVRDLAVAYFDPCNISIVAATICYGPDNPGNAVFTAEIPHLPSCLEHKKPRFGGGGGDPHIKRWNRERFSFHGECDLVLVRSDGFGNGSGLDLHVRATIDSYFSYFESAALRIGTTTIEFYRDHFYVNGIQKTLVDTPLRLSFGKMGEYWVENDASSLSTLTQKTTYLVRWQHHHHHHHDNVKNDASQIKIRFYKKFATIDLVGSPSDFGNATGLLGNYWTGSMVGRSGQVMHDFDEFGFEWQVSPAVDPQLFLQARAPQLPYERCRLPTAARYASTSRNRRRLGENAALLSSAQSACRHHVNNESHRDFELCVQDVVATGDVGLAELW